MIIVHWLHLSGKTYRKPTERLEFAGTVPKIFVFATQMAFHHGQ